MREGAESTQTPKLRVWMICSLEYFIMTMSQHRAEDSGSPSRQRGSDWGVGLRDLATLESDIQCHCAWTVNTELSGEKRESSIESLSHVQSGN